MQPPSLYSPTCPKVSPEEAAVHCFSARVLEMPLGDLSSVAKEAKNRAALLELQAHIHTLVEAHEASMRTLLSASERLAVVL